MPSFVNKIAPVVFLSNLPTWFSGGFLGTNSKIVFLPFSSDLVDKYPEGLFNKIVVKSILYLIFLLSNRISSSGFISMKGSRIRWPFTVTIAS